MMPFSIFSGASCEQSIFPSASKPKEYRPAIFRRSFSSTFFRILPLGKPANSFYNSWVAYFHEEICPKTLSTLA